MEQQADIQQTFNFEIERIYAGHFMLLAVCALFVRAAACSPLLEAEAVKLGRQHLMPFQGFKAEFRKSYRTEQEEVAKFRTYVETVQTVNKHNDEFKRGRHSFKLRLNQFADMSDDEFTTVMASCTSVKFPRFAASKGSEVGVIESAYQRLMHDFVAFSEQNLIDCDAWKWATGNDGCRGGNLENSFTFVQKHGLDTEKQYPFKGRTSGLYCYQKHNNEIPWMGPPSIVAIKRIRELELEEGTMNSEAEVILKSTLCHQGPLSVAIFLNKRDRSKFKSHGEGIFEAEDPTKCVREPGDVALAHAVLLAGYGRDQSPGVYKDYWLVKNSWGTAWGEAGYVRMRRNYVNCFNLANMVYWVVLDKNRTYPRNITRP